MRTHCLAAVVALALSCAFLTASCVRSPVAGEPSNAPSDPAERSSMDAEHIGEAEEPWTRHDCYVGYTITYMLCGTAGNLRPKCVAAVEEMLQRCLDRAED
jgi:hypothetical protein